MKSFSSFISENKSKAVQENKETAIKQSSIDKETIDTFKSQAIKMLSEDAVNVINSTGDNTFDETANKAVVTKLAKAGRIKELPWYLTKEELDDVVSGVRPLDFYAYDLVSEQGRNAMVSKFQPMIHRIAFKYANANGISSDDTYSAALEGFTRALNNYGKKRSEYVRTKSEEANVDLDKIAAQEGNARNIPFASYATAMVSNSILDFLKNEMNLVRRPQSDQAKERAATGNISSEKKVSGDAAAGKDKDGNERNMWDKLGDEIDNEAGGASLDNDDLQKLWKQIFDAVEDKFGKDVAELWYKKNGLNGRKQENKSSTPTEYYKLRNIAKFLMTDKKCRAALDEIRELMAE